MKTVPDILSLGINFRPIVMINTVLVMPGVSVMYNVTWVTCFKMILI